MWRANCVHCPTPFYIRKLRIYGFCNLWGSWNKSPCGYWGTRKYFVASKVIYRLLTACRSVPLTCALFRVNCMYIHECYVSDNPVKQSENSMWLMRVRFEFYIKKWSNCPLQVSWILWQTRPLILASWTLSLCLESQKIGLGLIRALNRAYGLLKREVSIGFFWSFKLKFWVFLVHVVLC